METENEASRLKIVNNGQKLELLQFHEKKLKQIGRNNGVVFDANQDSQAEALNQQLEQIMKVQQNIDIVKKSEINTAKLLMN